ncbi:MAG: IS3 family transposase [Chitinophagaceae bacterium]|nr:IS3 family transposase [Chitinophagaceae bacterium]
MFGKCRSALYDYEKRLHSDYFTDDIILQHVHDLRVKMPRIGTRKLHYLLVPMLAEHGIGLGRDQLFDLLDEHKLLIRRRKRKAITTDSRHWMHKWPNQIKELTIIRPEQLWVSDITYIRLDKQWAYLSLVTDAYSRQIMGYSFRTDMSVQGCSEALQMALSNRRYPWANLIHHSDRGSQYCSAPYVKLLHDNGIAISMTENGDPYENALAERMNGIIKDEFNLYESRVNLPETMLLIRQSINAYNHQRPHSSCNMLTPAKAHLETGILKKQWKNYQRKSGKAGKKEAGTAPITEQVPASFLPNDPTTTNLKNQAMYSAIRTNQKTVYLPQD